MIDTSTATTPMVRLGSNRGRWILAATVLSSGAIGIDSSVVNIALPAIGRDFHVPFSGLQWVVLAYTLTLAALILLGGTLGDRYGRRRVFILGIAGFGAASILCAAAPNLDWLIAARALQGVGGALATPASLAVIQSSYAHDDRGKAIGLWAGLSGVTSAIAPFVGGTLIEVAGWRSIFLINIPLVVTVIIIARLALPPTREPGPADRLDVVGSALVVLGLGGITFGVTEAAAYPLLTPAVIGSIGAGTLALVVFILIERKSDHPVLPLSIFKSMTFTATNLATFFDYAAFGAFFFLLPVYLEIVGRLTPLQAGATLLPITAITLCLSGVSGALAQRLGPRAQMTAGPLLAAVGILITTGLGNGRGYASVIVGVCVFGLGLATLVSPLTSAALSSVPPQHAGLSSGVNNAVARSGSLIAIAALPVFAGLAGTAYVHPQWFAAGYFVAALGCGSLLFAGAVTAAVGVEGHPSERGN